jgi:hypothetical protein
MVDEPPPVILPPAEAKKRFALYLAVKLLGYAALLGGVFLLSRGVTPIAVIVQLAGAASLLIRPKTLGLGSARRP